MFFDYILPLTRPFLCRAELDNRLNGLGCNAKARESLCIKCRSLACSSSKYHIPVKDWKCYPKEMENVL